ncbi:UDP-N-acetylglucosamine--N-acetylmuramyl-(pentapeptide) pyrophosphoryl-undecaprenol N-acetylglucosamine transferase [Rariglobus hedericola]|uniref:UDP-N-acetylglucosamine--N-acetylmuramyl- (pentapeptide) pyrophosphoryl-undecaprenol N-acetylglucosamine transferase n=1 Tax=Rariglobus hedericola TaxID=2597822 RepID=UPI001EF053F6|nr:UDP-N-acetylglucosamine--N-acetylmuramyl-(pentapeptide) pyrophosphoryl-undecaprenol N-acetylglucosamine transferase [Rariglobus hedericola]
MSTYLISCGGTGGHLSPGIALAEGLASRGHKATLLISQKRVDARLIEKYPDLNFVPIPGAPFTLQPGGFVKFIVSQTKGFFVSMKLVRTLKPAGIVGFGGFTTAAIIVAGRLRGVPVALHEANRVPGRAIRTLARFSRRVYLPPGINLPGLREGVIRHAGLPVRREITRLPREEACRLLGLDPSKKVLSIFGGSQGATVLNDWARRELPQLALEGIQLYCVTGLGKGMAEVQTLTAADRSKVTAVFSPFCDQVAALLSASDLVIGRAGAGSIAELIRCETPAIVLPYPHAADDHQRANAVWFEQQGAGLVIEQTKLPELTAAVFSLLRDDARRQSIRAHLNRLDHEATLTLILDDLENLNAGAKPAA